jgi:hypothetical protein
MKIDELRQLVQTEFGTSLKHATPANVREFIDKIEESTLSKYHGQRIEINEPSTSYEEILKDFFAKVLNKPAEEAVVTLYVLAMDLAFSGIESHYAERLAHLFQDMENDV